MGAIKLLNLIIKIMKTDEHFEHRYLEDVKRIQSLLEKYGWDLSLHECANLWDRRSDLFAAGWLGLPKSDSDLWNELASEFTTDSKKDTERDPFETIVRPVMKYLADHHHPHVTIVITSTNAQLVEGIKSTGEIMDYIKD